MKKSISTIMFIIVMYAVACSPAQAWPSGVEETSVTHSLMVGAKDVLGHNATFYSGLFVGMASQQYQNRSFYTCEKQTPPRQGGVFLELAAALQRYEGSLKGMTPEQVVTMLFTNEYHCKHNLS